MGLISRRCIASLAALAALAGGCSLLDLSALSSGEGGAGGGGLTASTAGSTTGSADPCAGVTCSMSGTCDPNPAPHCVCDAHFEGPDCATCSAPYMGADCLACAVGYQDADDDGTCALACGPDTCSGHGACDDASGAAVCTCDFGWSGADCATACVGGAGPRCDFQLVYGLDLPATGADWELATDVPYDTMNLDVPAFTRVAYRLVLDADEVWVEMDAFTADPAQLGVPVTFEWDIPVTNVVVQSKAANLASIPVPSAGALEFWSQCYDEGASGMFDTDDNWGGEPSCYGSMQVHVGVTTILAVNSWGNGGALDLGIGTAKSGQPDWTFHGNSASFTTRRLEVYVRP